MTIVLDRQVDDHVRHLVVGLGYVFGTFTCPPSSRRWSEPNWIGPHATVAFGAAPVRISADGGLDLVGTANEAFWYAADTEYRRQPIGDRGDQSMFVRLDDALAADLTAGARPRRRIADVHHVAGRYALGLRLRQEATADQPDLLALDVWALDIASSVAAGASAVDDAARRSRGTAIGRAVSRVREMLAADAQRPWTLAELAESVHYSPWALSRGFSLQTGTSIAAYRQQLRLRAAATRLVERPVVDLSGLAFEHGFSSHSHFTRAFRTAFGCPPSAFVSRRRAPGRLSD